MAAEALRRLRGHRRPGTAQNAVGTCCAKTAEKLGADVTIEGLPESEAVFKSRARCVPT